MSKYAKKLLEKREKVNPFALLSYVAQFSILSEMAQAQSNWTKNWRLSRLSAISQPGYAVVTPKPVSPPVSPLPTPSYTDLGVVRPRLAIVVKIQAFADSNRRPETN